MYLLSELSICSWNKDVLSEQTSWILKLLETIPVYRLDCRPNEASVELLYNELGFGE